MGISGTCLPLIWMYNRIRDLGFMNHKSHITNHKSILVSCLKQLSALILVTHG